VAETLGLTRNAVSQYRHRRGISRPVCEARTRIIREPEAGFYVFVHKGTGARMVSLFPNHKGITLTRFFTECRIGRTLHRDEVAMASGVIRRLPNWGFRAMHARRESERRYI
jgi:predicted transcriptional regulator